MGIRTLGEHNSTQTGPLQSKFSAGSFEMAGKRVQTGGTSYLPGGNLTCQDKTKWQASSQLLFYSLRWCLTSLLFTWPVEVQEHLSCFRARDNLIFWKFYVCGNSRIKEVAELTESDSIHFLPICVCTCIHSNGRFGRWTHGLPKAAHSLILRAYACYLIWTVSEGRIKLGIWRCRNYPGLSGWTLNAISSVLTRGRHREITDRSQVRGAEAERRGNVSWPWRCRKGAMSPWKKQRGRFLPNSSGESMALLTPWF